MRLVLGVMKFWQRRKKNGKSILFVDYKITAD